MVWRAARNKLFSEACLHAVGHAFGAIPEATRLRRSRALQAQKGHRPPPPPPAHSRRHKTSNDGPATRVGVMDPDLERGSIGFTQSSTTDESKAGDDKEETASEVLEIHAIAIGPNAKNEELEYPSQFVPETPFDPLFIHDDALPDFFIPHVPHEELQLRLPRKGRNTRWYAV
jgi:hypothetical protein